MAESLRHVSPLLKLIIIGSFAVGLALALIGVWLVYLGATGDTAMDFMGNSFRSRNVGVASIFIGGVVAATTVRRVFKTIELGMTHAAGSSSAGGDKSISSTQREILEVIVAAGSRGVYAGDLVRELALDRELVVYRARDLEQAGYITTDGLTDYLYTATCEGRRVASKKQRQSTEKRAPAGASEQGGASDGHQRRLCRELNHRLYLTRRELVGPDPTATPNASRLLPLTVPLHAGCAYGTSLFQEFDGLTVRQIVARWEEHYPDLLRHVDARLNELESADSSWRRVFDQPEGADLVKKMLALVTDLEAHLSNSLASSEDKT